MRELKVRQRACCAEFETKPDQELLPYYFKVIQDPVFLEDLDDAVRSGGISDPDSLAKRFKLLVRNAKVFNKPGSTISKDASRLFDVFRTAMKDEFGLVVDEYEDEDEEDAWARDLAERPRLALAEREGYRELQASWDHGSATSRRSPSEKFWHQFEQTPLPLEEMPCAKLEKKELNRTEFISETSKLRMTGTKRASHDVDSCLACCEEPVAPPKVILAKTYDVITPKYREIKPVRFGAPKATAPMKIDPIADKTLKRVSKAMDSPDVRTKLHKARKEETCTKNDRRRSESPDTVIAVRTPLLRSRAGRVKVY